MQLTVILRKVSYTGGTTLQLLRVMKLTAIILLGICTAAAARGHSQGITLDVKDAPIKQIFKEVIRQTGVSIIYDAKLFKDVGPVTIKVTNASIDEVIHKCLAGLPYTYSRDGNKIVVKKSALPGAVKPDISNAVADVEATPPINIRGRIVNEQGQPLARVSVVVTGTSTGTISNELGEFALDVLSGDATLVFSSTGYLTQEIKINNRTLINVTMVVNTLGLSEVVMIGYGSRSKRDVTTSISTLNADKIEKQIPASPELLMQGQMSGVQVIGNTGNPTARPTVRIRGTNTWGISDPLYVIDGIPIKEYGAGIEGTDNTNQFVRGYVNIMAMIDPSDIESVSVLKDASAGSVYGVRAGNGVVLITTKKGKKGAPAVNVSLRYGIQNIYKRLALLNSQQYADFHNALYASDPASANSRSVLNYVFDPNDPGYLGNSPTYDWQGALRNKNAPSQDYSINVSGGSDRADYYASFGYTDQEGVNIYNFMKRYSGSFKLNVDLTRFLRVGINYRLAYQQAKNFSFSPVDLYQTPPSWQPIYDAAGINGYAAAIDGFDANGVWKGNVKYGNYTRFNYPGYMSLRHFPLSGLRNLGNAYIELTPFKYLKIKGAINIDRFDNSSRRLTQYASTYFQYGGTNPTKKGAPGSVGEYMQRSSLNLNIIKEITASYSRPIGNHNIDILFNAMSQKYSIDYFDGNNASVPSADFNLASLGGDNQYLSVTSFVRKGALVGTLLRASYNYAGKYYLDVAVRRDGSSRFAPENRWGTFPAISAAWRLSKEKFLQNVLWLDDLKLRAGWGKLGNQEVKDLAYLSVINTSPAYAWGNNSNNDGRGYLSTAAAVFGMPNKDLSWEKTATINIGFDAVLLKSLTLSAEYYTKMTDGILQTLTVPPSVGLIERPVGNIAKVQNKGIEVNINYSGNFGNLNYSVGGNFTTVHNEVIKMYGGIPMSNIEEGYSLFYIKGFQIDGRFKTNEEVTTWLATHNDLRYKSASVKAGDFYFKDLRGAPGPGDKFYSQKPDGIIDDYDQVYLGKTIPGYFYGLNLNVGYRNFDFTATFTGVGDVQKTNSIKTNLIDLDGEGVLHTTDALNYWTATNTNTNLPRLIWQDPADNRRFSNFSVEDAGYLRLSNVQVGYMLPAFGLQKVIKYTRIYIGSSNAFTLTKFSGLDPEDENNPAPVVFYAGISVRF